MGNVGSVDIEELKRARQQLNEERGIETDPDMYKNYNPNRAKEESENQQSAESSNDSFNAKSSDEQNFNSNNYITENISDENSINAENLETNSNFSTTKQTADLGADIEDEKLENIVEDDEELEEDDEDFDIGDFFDKLLNNDASQIEDEKTVNNEFENKNESDNLSESVDMQNNQDNSVEQINNDLVANLDTTSIEANQNDDSFGNLAKFDLQSSAETFKEPAKIFAENINNTERDFSVYDNFAEFEVKGYETNNNDSTPNNSEISLSSEENTNVSENLKTDSDEVKNEETNSEENLSQTESSDKEELLNMISSSSENLDNAEQNANDNDFVSDTKTDTLTAQTSNIEPAQTSNIETMQSENFEDKEVENVTNLEDNTNNIIDNNDNSENLENAATINDNPIYNEIPVSKDAVEDENVENPFIRLDSDVIITDKEESLAKNLKDNKEPETLIDLKNDDVIDNNENFEVNNEISSANDNSEDFYNYNNDNSFGVEDIALKSDDKEYKSQEVDNENNFDSDTVNLVAQNDISSENDLDEKSDKSLDNNENKNSHIDYFKKIEDYSFVDVLQTEEFKSSDNLSYLFGKDEEGRLMFMNMRDMFNTAIFGNDEQAIFAHISSMLLSLSLKNTVNDVNFVICDSKLQSDYDIYNKSSYMFFNRVAKTNREILDTLAELENELEERYNTLVEAGAKSIEHYNKFASEAGISKLPYIIIVFNNYNRAAGLMLGEQINICLANLLKLGRIVGVYAVVSASEAINNRDVNLNLSGRIAFKTDSEDLSDFEVGSNDAVRLSDSKEFVYSSVKGDEIFHLKTAKLTKSETDLILENLES